MGNWREGDSTNLLASQLQARLAPINYAQKPYGNDHGVIVAGTAIASNNIRGIRYTIEKTGSLTGITVYTLVTSGNLVAGVYDTSVTNINRLAYTGVVAASATNSWQTGLDFTTPLSVTVGQQVFVCAHVDNATLSLGRTGNPANNATAGPLPAGCIDDADGTNLLMWNNIRGSFSSPLPLTIATSGLAANAGGFSFYCKYA